MIYIVTLRHAAVPLPPVITWLVVTGLVVCVETASWVAAPVHSEPYDQLTAPFGDLASVALFNGTFDLLLMITTSATAWLAWSKAMSPGDPTRTISLALTGSACVAGTVMFGLLVAVTMMRYVGGDGSVWAEEAAVAMMPYVLILLAMGTLSLWLAPPVIAYLQSFHRWRTLRPLWLQLVALQPSVHLNAPIRGTPARRMHIRIQRSVVEIHDALRLTSVGIQPTAGVEELGRALRRRPAGSLVAADVLARTATHDTDIAQLLELARTFARSIT